MIDLHCHLLPAIDDGARDLETALEMARIAVADGITMTACTPHIYPGLFDNTGEAIKRHVEKLQRELQDADIALEITYGADIQIVPEMVSGLRSGHMPTLHGSRYCLFEPPHHTAPAGFASLLFDVLAAGYIPVITHPERLTWLNDDYYDWFADAVISGAWIQLTAGALTGRFGRNPTYWSERFLDDGLVHILATDAHDTRHRAPLLNEGRVAAEHWVGAEEAHLLVSGRPQAIIANLEPMAIPPPPALRLPTRQRASGRQHQSWLRRFFSG
ncbi:capsular biosynthesis protein [Thiocystis minor]|uniref:tyrosine-protein phosphatase n=1 Tax=Thiocystis minor TaxID=61597 RepID=UPI00191300FF|nr:CpsB/CapC family capsule biosynthesis tyrosine phosphatase [Thiocystis minor]MBK5965856.1 capsular biosynthesis protein [Thiocystis minor]